MIEKLRPFKHLCMTIGNLPTSYLDSMSYYETLCWLCKYLKDEVVPVVNNNSKVVEELETYVKTYFDNLDVQEEINNKLDEMATSGQLTDIIAQYLELAGLLVYNTLNELKTASNLSTGSTVKTIGRNSVNDNGGAIYKVRNILNTDIIDNNTKVALSDASLIAELILDSTMNIEVFDNLENACSISAEKKFKLIVSKDLILNSDITLDNVKIDFNNKTITSEDCEITISGMSVIENVKLIHTTILLMGGRNRLENITLVDFTNSAITIECGYEDIINNIRIENNTNSTSTVAIENNSSDETITNVYGFGAYTGIISNGSNNTYENIHLWLNNNNTFTDSKFFNLKKTANQLINCCSDSYNIMLYMTNDYLNTNITNGIFINNNILFKNKNFKIVDGSYTNTILNGDLTLKLTEFTTNGNTVNLNNSSNLFINRIDGECIERVGKYGYQLLQTLVNNNSATVNEVSNIEVNRGKLNLNMMIYCSGTSVTSLSIDLTSFIGINKHKIRSFISAEFNNYNVFSVGEIQLNNGILSISIPNRSAGSSFSAIPINISL